VTPQHLLHRRIACRHFHQSSVLEVAARSYVRARCDKPVDDGWVIGASRFPVYGTERCPPERRTLVGRIPGVDRHTTVREETFDHPDAANPAGCVKCRPAVDPRRARVEPEAKHEIGSLEALVKDGDCQIRMVPSRQGTDE
jgi:hypothetical protein